MTTQMTPEEVVRAWNEAYSKQNLDAALEFMSEDFIRLGDSNRWTPANKQTWAAPQKTFFAAFPDWTWDMNSLIASGDTVVCEFLEHGTFTKPFDVSCIVGRHLGRSMTGLTLAPTGEAYADHNCDVFRVKDGLITELRAYITNNLDRIYHFESRIMELVAAKRASSASK